jgi:hypothetical protein
MHLPQLNVVAFGRSNNLCYLIRTGKNKEFHPSRLIVIEGACQVYAPDRLPGHAVFLTSRQIDDGRTEWRLAPDLFFSHSQRFILFVTPLTLPRFL